MKRKLTLEDVCVRIERWEKRIRRAENALSKLNTQRRRLERKAKLIEQAKVPPAPTTEQRWKVDRHGVPEAVSVAAKTWAELAPPADMPDIPDYLKRVQAGKDRDAIAAKAIQAEQAERKKNKARVRIDEMKAKQSGEARKMPLQGKAALAAIRG